MRDMTFTLIFFVLAALQCDAKCISLLIANDKYDTRPLINPSRDVEMLRGILEKNHCMTTVMTNDTESNLISSLSRMRATLVRGDVLLVYYTGHGIESDGIFHLVMTQRIKDKRLDQSGHEAPLSLTHLLQPVLPNNGFSIFVVIDSCRSKLDQVTARPPAYSARLYGGLSDIVLLFSTAPGMPAFDNSNLKYSFFATQLATALQSTELSQSTMHSIAYETSANMLLRSSVSQQPWIVTIPGSESSTLMKSKRNGLEPGSSLTHTSEGKPPLGHSLPYQVIENHPALITWVDANRACRDFGLNLFTPIELERIVSSSDASVLNNQAVWTNSNNTPDGRCLLWGGHWHQSIPAKGILTRWLSCSNAKVAAAVVCKKESSSAASASSSTSPVMSSTVVENQQAK